MESPNNCMIEDIREDGAIPPMPKTVGFSPTRLCNLGDYVPIKWFWEGFVAPKRKTIFVGHPKAGKTTLMSHLVKGLSGVSCNIGSVVNPSKVLILTEEHDDLWKRRRDDLHINGENVWVQRIKRASNSKAWCTVLSDAENLMIFWGIETLIIDTLSSLWPCDDENDAISVGIALDPINKLADRGFAVVCVHHAPKAKQSAVISARGSTAITAFFDIVINMRTAGRGSHTTRRSLKGWGRDLETPETLILEYQGTDGYVASTGDDDEDGQIATMNMNRVIKGIPTVGDGIGMEDLRKNIQMAHLPLKGILERAVAMELVHVNGTGVKGNPFRYLRAETPHNACLP